jgi:hypothetical protein
VDALKSGPAPTTDPVELHRINIQRTGPHDVLIAAYPGSGSALLGNILTELGFAHLDPYSEVLDTDGTSTVIPDLVPYRSRLAATAASDAAEHPGQESPIRFVKNHLLPRHFGTVAFGGAILLVRDPRDAVHSSYRWFRGFSPIWQPEGGRGQGTFAEFLDGLGVNDEAPIQGWADFYRDWQAVLPTLARGAIVRFEDLKATPVAVLDRLLRELGVPRPASSIGRAVERSSYENMRAHEERIVGTAGNDAAAAPMIMRRGKVNEWREWFGDPALAAPFQLPELVELAAGFGYHLGPEGDSRDLN